MHSHAEIQESIINLDASLRFRLLGKSAILHIAYSHGFVRFSVCVCLYVAFVIAGRIFAKIKIVKYDVYWFWYLSSNGVILNVILRTLDLLLKVRYLFQILISRKRWELTQNMWYDFYRFLYLPSNGAIPKLYTETLTYFFKVKYFKC